MNQKVGRNPPTHTLSTENNINFILKAQNELDGDAECAVGGWEEDTIVYLFDVNFQLVGNTYCDGTEFVWGIKKIPNTPWWEMSRKTVIYAIQVPPPSESTFVAKSACNFQFPIATDDQEDFPIFYNKSSKYLAFSLLNFICRPVVRQHTLFMFIIPIQSSPW